MKRTAPLLALSLQKLVPVGKVAILLFRLVRQGLILR